MPTPRKASLRVAHGRGCRNATQTSLDSLRGCTCKPSYYTFHRDASGKPVKGARVRDRRVAERALMKLQVEIDEGRLGIVRSKDVSFADWSRDYLETVESRVRSGELHPRTLVSYKRTLDKAARIFGGVPLPKVGPVYLHACRLAVESGLRMGELIALDWRNVNLLSGSVLVEHQVSAGELLDPK